MPLRVAIVQYDQLECEAVWARAQADSPAPRGLLPDLPRNLPPLPNGVREKDAHTYQMLPCEAQAP